MNISIVGTGYVGLVTGTCFAELGNKVICVDVNKDKIECLKRGIIPIYEPGLEELVHKNTKAKRLSFTTNIKEAVRKSKVIFIAVGTPAKTNGEADLTAVEQAATQIAKALTPNSYKVIVEKSTVPVNTGFKVAHVIELYNHRKIKFDIASNPEFLREGSAISDFMHPDRVVIGVESDKAKKILTQLYKPLNAPILVTDIKSAELIKHASNSFLSTKISFINAIANICERVGADVKLVAEGMGLDKRIGKEFLSAGVGYGGSCFPKDTDAFIQIADEVGYDFELLKAVRRINQQQRLLLIKKIEDAIWIIKDKTIGILGLSFKPNTDDTRSAPSIDIISNLLARGAKIKAYDPQVKEPKDSVFQNLQFCKDAYEVAKDSDCLVLLTEWQEFKELDFVKIKRLLKQPIIIDGRNLYEPYKMKKLGFEYIGFGRNSYH
jgi:UDPglucose 6-dehydrogenase